ncbi:hypothetical protein cypCar_00031604, partial [Cyprinus carpio]
SFLHLGAGLSVGLSGLAAGFAIGIVGDAGVRGTAQQPRLFVGMILILIFAEVLGLYGLIVALILSTKGIRDSNDRSDIPERQVRRLLVGMSRRSRNSRAWRYVWSGIRRDADARALVLASENEEWGYDHQQYSDSDSEAEYPAIVPAVPSAVPVTGESYCSCDSQMELSCNPRLRGYTHMRDCHCGEDDQDFDWVWDEGSRSSATLLSCENRKVSFHSEYSCGTAAIRGSKELSEGQHFWEIKMTSPVYGTDMGSNYWCSLGHLGTDKNRKCIGVAATEMKNKSVFPMACSTAAKSSMKVIRSVSAATSLQYLCCSRLRKLLPSGVDALRVLPLPPGLRHLLHSKLGWVLSLDHTHTHSNTHTPPGPSSGSDSEGCSSDPEACQRKRCRWT